MRSRRNPRAGRAALATLQAWKCNPSMLVIRPSLKPQRAVMLRRGKSWSPKGGILLLRAYRNRAALTGGKKHFSLVLSFLRLKKEVHLNIKNITKNKFGKRLYWTTHKSRLKCPAFFFDIYLNEIISSNKTKQQKFRWWKSWLSTT